MGSLVPPRHIRENDVVLYHDHSLEAERAEAILRDVGVRFASVEVDDVLAREVADYSGWPTFPQLFVSGQFIGGLEYMEAMHAKGELQSLTRDLPTSSKPSRPDPG